MLYNQQELNPITSKNNPSRGYRAACAPTGRSGFKRISGDTTFKDRKRPRNSEVRYSTLPQEEINRIFHTAAA